MNHLGHKIAATCVGNAHLQHTRTATSHFTDLANHVLLSLTLLTRIQQEHFTCRGKGNRSTTHHQLGPQIALKRNETRT